MRGKCLSKLSTVLFLCCSLLSYSSVAHSDSKVAGISSINYQIDKEIYFFYMRGVWKQSSSCEGDNTSDWIVISKDEVVVKSMLEIALKAIELNKNLSVSQDTCWGKHPVTRNLFMDASS